MAIKLTFWRCGRCPTQYSTEEQADQCTISHPDPSEYFLDGMAFSNLEGKYSINRADSQIYPERINIGLKGHQTAYYTLSRIGPKGV